MALSDYEKQVLDEMEAQFRSVDPDLSKQMASAQTSSRAGITLSVRRIAVGIVIAVIGLGVLVAAVSLGYSLWSILLGVLGFVLMVAGIWFALSSPKNAAANGSRPGGGSRKPSAWSHFIADQERRWEERRRDD
ncbi:DUF3040 domain-containing protein [Actinomyces mediterranea]|uniref:DUF3040 domain-containing protein n=1 Tax=Actinomyces mediterranea TaxID=1871028 RepID=UPI000970B20C|nr:DUF3040 domain-containing protein [Actinomyces mediterranea]